MADIMTYPAGFVSGLYDDADTYKWQVSLGNHNFPERRVESASEMYAMLGSAAGRNQTGEIRPWCMSGQDFTGSRHILGVNFMRTHMYGSGVSTRAGDVIRLALYDRNVASSQAAWLILQSDVMISITEAGVQVMD